MAKKQTATQKLRAQVKNAVRYRERKGWVVPQEIKDNINTKGYQYLKSLHDRGYRKLDESIQVEDTFTGETITGQQAKVRSRWNVQERERRKLLSDWEKMRQNPEFQRAYSEGYIVAERINETIETLKRFDDPMGTILEREFKIAMLESGSEVVYNHLAKNYDRLMSDIDLAIKYQKGASYHDQAVLDIISVMRDTIMTSEEAHRYAEEAETFDVFDEFSILDEKDLLAIAKEYKQNADDFSDQAELEKRVKKTIRKGRDKSRTKLSLFDDDERRRLDLLSEDIKNTDYSYIDEAEEYW